MDNIEEKSAVFTKAKFDLLEKAYYKALDTNLDSFLFDGQELLVSYAGYLLMYLSPKFKNMK